MNEFLESLKRQAIENPIVALGVGAALITAMSKLVDSTSDSRNSKAWAKEVERRNRKSK